MIKQKSNLQLIFNRIVPNQNMSFNSIKENLIGYLLQEGRIVYIHSKGFFPSLQQACQSPDGKAIKGAIHLMEWMNNLFVVEVSKGSMRMLRKLYELQVDSLLISQVNWTRMLSSFGGEVNYNSEHLNGNILKTASLVIQKKVEAKKIFFIQQQQLEEAMPIEQQETPQRQQVQQVTQNLNNLMFTPTRYIQANVTESQQFHGVIVEWIRNNVRQDHQNKVWTVEMIYDGCYGLIFGNQLVQPDYQNFETTQGHCQNCGLYPNQEFHSCNGVLVRR